MPNDELPIWQVSEYTRTIDLANARTRVRQRREAKFLFAGALTQQLTQGLDGDIAYNTAPDGTMTRAADSVARDRRLELLQHPITIVRAALDPGAKLANVRADVNDDLVDVTTAKGDVLTLGVDRTTHLPSRVRYMSDNANMGDVAMVTTFEDYQDVSGLKLPRRITTMMDKYLQFGVQVSKTPSTALLAILRFPRM
jgi:hypothetical protein